MGMQRGNKSDFGERIVEMHRSAIFGKALIF